MDSLSLGGLGTAAELSLLGERAHRRVCGEGPGVEGTGLTVKGGCYDIRKEELDHLPGTSLCCVPVGHDTLGPSGQAGRGHACFLLPLPELAVLGQL